MHCYFGFFVFDFKEENMKKNLGIWKIPNLELILTPPLPLTFGRLHQPLLQSVRWPPYLYFNAFKMYHKKHKKIFLCNLFLSNKKTPIFSKCMHYDDSTFSKYMYYKNIQPNNANWDIYNLLHLKRMFF